MITARYTWEAATLQKGFALHRKGLVQAKVIPWLAVVFIALGICLSLKSGHSWIEGAPPVFFGLLLLVLWRPVAFWQFRRAVRRSPSHGSEMTYTFDPEQVTISGEGHHSTFTWKKLYSATVTDEGVLLYTNKNLFHWIPVTAFPSPSDIATVQGYLQQNGVRTRNA